MKPIDPKTSQNRCLKAYNQKEDYGPISSFRAFLNENENPLIALPPAQRFQLILRGIAVSSKFRINYVES